MTQHSPIVYPCQISNINTFDAVISTVALETPRSYSTVQQHIQNHTNKNPAPPLRTNFVAFILLPYQEILIYSLFTKCHSRNTNLVSQVSQEQIAATETLGHHNDGELA